jgi:hypothetical protein
MPPLPFRESISWIISPFKLWTATIFLHVHLHVVYYKCAKFHINPIRSLGGVAPTRYMDGRTDRVIPIYPPPPTLFAGGIIMFWVQCCDVRYNLRIETMFGSSLPPVYCRRASVLFTLFVFASS